MFTGAVAQRRGRSTGGTGPIDPGKARRPGTIRRPGQPMPRRPTRTVTPHASFLALDVLPQQAYANIQALRTLYPGIYDANGGFFDAVNPTTGAVGHRRLVLDQSMIMAALDNALNHDAMQQHFASDPVSWAARLYLGDETMSIGQ